jgi:hypothetical protein
LRKIVYFAFVDACGFIFTFARIRTLSLAAVVVIAVFNSALAHVVVVMVFGAALAAMTEGKIAGNTMAAICLT